MSEANQISEEKIQNFCSLTGINKERAKFYLEASNGDLEAAIGTFFEGGPSSDQDLARSSQQMNSDDDDDDTELDYNPNPSSAYRSGAVASSNLGISKNETKPIKGKVFTLRDTVDENNEEDNEDDKGQAFYAGGSETSGQQIIGPSKKNSEHIIKDLFKKAKEHGAREVNENDQLGASNKDSNIYGTGYRLGTGEEPSEVVRGPPRPKPPKVNVLKLWKNGFTIDDGILRSYQDPNNQEFLDSIQKGVPPRELIRQSDGAEVNLDMQDHRDEDYIPPKGKYVLYNDGYKLGSPTPTVVSNATAQEQLGNEDLAKRALNLDNTKPITQVQIRLSNGSKLIIKANQSHTIADIRRYINQARPEYNQRNYYLMMSFPNKEITNEEQTLTEANLLNAVIIQKL